jgi:transposase
VKTTTIAVDVATAHLEIAVSNRAGRVSERRRLARSRVLPYFRKQPSATVLLEACASAHHWARELQGLGHKVVLLPPHAVRPYVTRNKTDKTDAKALLEAYRNEDIRPVPVKSPDQQALAAIHRLRSSWVATRTARLNALRGFAKELGLVIPTGVRHVALNLRAALEDADSPIPYSLRPLLAEGRLAAPTDPERRSSIHAASLTRPSDFASSSAGVESFFDAPGATRGATSARRWSRIGMLERRVSPCSAWGR